MWNGQYQLTAVSTNGVECERNGYDAFGRRVWTWDPSTGSGQVATNYFVYSGNQVIADVDATGGLRRAYVWGPGIDNLLAMTVYTGATVKTYFALTDHQGTVHALADETGAIVESYRFNAWGRVLGVYDSNNQQLNNSQLGNRYLFQGREYSWNTGLYNFRARWYDPITGRWLSNDPIGISGGLNQYVFCSNNPVNMTDPLGLWGVQFGGLKIGSGDLWMIFDQDAAMAYSRGGQGVVNAFTGGLFSEKYGLFYDKFNKQWKDLGYESNECNKDFKTCMTGGRVAEAALLAAGAVWGWQAAGGATMDIAVGPGTPFHVAYGSGGQWVHALGRIGAQQISSRFVQGFVAESWFQVTGIPIANSAATLATGGSATTCIGAAIRAFFHGWGL